MLFFNDIYILSSYLLTVLYSFYDTRGLQNEIIHKCHSSFPS